MNENKKRKEMTKEQMKEYFYNIIEDLKRQAETCENLITIYEEKEIKEGITESENNILQFSKQDKHTLLNQRFDLEQMFEKMFAIRYFDYQWDKKHENN